MSYFFNNFSPRQIHLIIFLIVGSLLGYAAYSMKILGLEPCTLCLTQQFFYCLIGISSFVAFLHNPKINFSKLYSIFLSLFALAGMWISGRQIWLQGFGGGGFPFADVINALFMGDGNCAEIPWQFLGLSMAGWSFVWFLVILILSLTAIFKSKLSS